MKTLVTGGTGLVGSTINADVYLGSHDADLRKWSEVKKINPKIRLHMVGKLQTNKVKFAVQLFD